MNRSFLSSCACRSTILGPSTKQSFVLTRKNLRPTWHMEVTPLSYLFTCICSFTRNSHFWILRRNIGQGEMCCTFQLWSHLIWFDVWSMGLLTFRASEKVYLKWLYKLMGLWALTIYKDNCNYRERFYLDGLLTFCISEKLYLKWPYKVVVGLRALTLFIKMIVITAIEVTLQGCGFTSLNTIYKDNRTYSERFYFDGSLDISCIGKIVFAVTLQFVGLWALTLFIKIIVIIAKGFILHSYQIFSIPRYFIFKI